MKSILLSLILALGLSVPNQSNAMALGSAGTPATVIICGVTGGVLVLGGLVSAVASDSVAGQNFGWLILGGIVLDQQNTKVLESINYKERLAELRASSVYTTEQAAIISADLKNLESSNSEAMIKIDALKSKEGTKLVTEQLKAQGLNELTVNFILNLIGVQSN